MGVATQVEVFSKNLSIAIKNQEYLAFEKENYTVVKDKNKTKVNTEAILLIADLLFSQVVKDRRLEVSEKIRLLKNLKVTLNAYRSRIDKKVNFLVKVFTPSSGKDTQQEHLNSTVGKINTIISNYKFFQKDVLQFSQSVIKNSLKQIAESSLWKLKYFYFTVLDTTKFYSNNLNGATAEMTLYMVLENLRSYYKNNESTLDAFACYQLKNAIKELEFALEISVYQRFIQMSYNKTFLSASNLPGETKEKKQWNEQLCKALKNAPLVKKEMISRILKKVKKLSAFSFGNDQQTLLLLGGCYNEKGGHTISFQIEKDEEGLYQFSIINTGKGVRKHQQPGMKKYWSNEQSKFYDKVYRGITKEQLSASFFSQLLSYSMEEKSCTISDVYQFIDRRLLSSTEDNVSTGNLHKLQMKGSCSLKCITAWLHNRLPNSVYWPLKVDITKSQMNEFKEMVRKKDPIFFQISGRCKSNENLLKRLGKKTPTLYGNEIIKAMEKEGRNKLLKRMKHLPVEAKTVK